ncbi:MAG: methyltransferase domain-containing protein [Candidatus Promineifilaceae bacterium]|jgi:ubiquinone/menaquinone biosynthesis C-methylase UbiE
MSRESVLQQFGANAASYTTSETHAKGASLGRLRDLIQAQAHWQVLDIATGTGHTAFTFAPHVSRVTATDITPEMLAQAEALAMQKGLDNIVFETVDSGDLPFAEASFDLVSCRIAPHHFPDCAQFIREVARVLKSGGLLAVVDNIVPPGIVGDYINAFEKLRDPSHERCLSQEEWLELFTQARLEITHHETLRKRLDFQFWAQRHHPIMQNYLRALLLEGGSRVSAFLQPETNNGQLSFALVEGIVIGQKAA